MFASVIVNITHQSVDRKFEYSVPENLSLSIGQSVTVPFAGKPVEGIVLQLSENCEYDIEKIKPVISVSDMRPVVTQEQIKLAEFISAEYRIPLASSLQLMIPNGIRNRLGPVMEKAAFLCVPYEQALAAVTDRQGNIKFRKQYELIEKINMSGHASVGGGYGSSAKGLEKKGIVEIREIARKNEFSFTPSESEDFELTSEQTSALEKIHSCGKRKFLIHGVTGSGKTEIYIRLIRETLEKGKTCILLVPEISLTPQTCAFVAGRIDSDIALFHSGLSDAERFTEWEKVRSGHSRLVIGARSAVFAPLENLGLIIIDEEHESSYRADNYPKYTAHSVAEKRCELNDALLVLGSATPSVKTYYEAQNGKYELIELKNRVNGVEMPPVRIVDMRTETENGNTSMLSGYLVSGLSEVLKEKKQAMLFLNRRGYSNYLMCLSCGHVIRCSACEVSMTYHKSSGKLKCHYCGRTAEVPKVCPSCGKPYIKYVGAGTQQLEEILGDTFPSARVLRMDLDTTMHKNAHEEIYKAFAEHEADIMVGTQMITKGFDFRDVKLSAIINADSMLNFPDYRSNEDTFMNLTQLAGRAGRRGGGEVVLQTYNPDSFVILAASEHDYSAFYRKEIRLRELGNMPPFTNYIKISFSGLKEEDIIDAVKDMLRKLSSAIKDKRDIISIDACESNIKRINNYIYYEINICLKKVQSHDTINVIRKVFEGAGYKGVLVGLDME